mgnify:FL=1
MAEVTRSCVDCAGAVTKSQGVALCPACVLERNRRRAREQYYKSQAKKGAPRRGDVIPCRCDYCGHSFESVLAGKPRRVCDECNRRKGGQARERWRKENPEAAAAIKARYRVNHPDRERGRAAVLRYRRYGVSAEWEAATIEAQGHKCGNPACDATEPGGRWPTWHIDHCHRTGKVRGLLCDRCNKGVGLFDDDPAKLAGMIEYLTRERE